MAIIQDAISSSENQTGSSVTFSHTCSSGSNLILIFAVSIADTGNTVGVSTITYAGVGATKISHDATLTNRRTELWYLLAPTAGANNIIVTLTGAPSSFFNVGASSYTGVKQSAQPDASGIYATTSSVADITKSITTIADNCWLVGAGCDGATANPVADAGSTFRASVYNRAGNGYELFLLDSNGAKTPAGSYALGWSHDSSGGNIIVASIAPYIPVSLTLTAGVGSFTMTFVDAVVGRLYTMVATVGSILLTGIDTTFRIITGISWSNQSKNSSSMTNQSKNSASPSNLSKNSSTWSNTNKSSL